MAKVITDARIYVAEFDLSGVSNQVELSIEVDPQEVTNFDSNGWREHKAGLFDSTLTTNGFVDYETSEKALHGALGTSRIVSVAESAAVGSTAWLGRRMGVSMSPGATVGQATQLSGTLRSTTPEGVVEGIVLAAASTVTASGTSTPVEHAAIGAGEVGWAALHVFETSGTPTLDVVVQSDDASGFASPTSRITFAQATGVGSQFLSVAGAVTDDWWRCSFTVGGGSPSVRFAVVFGIR
jgi:hypothetical protein